MSVNFQSVQALLLSYLSFSSVVVVVVFVAGVVVVVVFILIVIAVVDLVMMNGHKFLTTKRKTAYEEQTNQSKRVQPMCNKGSANSKDDRKRDQKQQHST